MAVADSLIWKTPVNSLWRSTHLTITVSSAELPCPPAPNVATSACTNTLCLSLFKTHCRIHQSHSCAGSIALSRFETECLAALHQRHVLVSTQAVRTCHMHVAPQISFAGIRAKVCIPWGAGCAARHARVSGRCRCTRRATTSSSPVITGVLSATASLAATPTQNCGAG